MLMLPFYNYFYGNHDAIREMLTHPGRGVGTVRRRRALRHDLRRLVSDVPADALGAGSPPGREAAAGVSWCASSLTTPRSCSGSSDRGVIRSRKEGRHQRHRHGCADLAPARMAYDLPAGGQRLVQGASGYSATIVNGVVTRRDGVDTGARPGRLVRGAR